ncbi:unannotated protein [freshwater metagenome]|uniref:Unannotated protein n=1 Tax=freshwater metagenome TaxID=449393 RepID=A0A6J6YFC1_9ZZZZ
MSPLARFSRPYSSRVMRTASGIEPTCSGTVWLTAAIGQPISGGPDRPAAKSDARTIGENAVRIN